MRLRKWKTKCLSVLLTFSMAVSSLTAGQFTGRTDAKAADEEAEIVLGELQKGSGYYTYPNASVQAGDSLLAELTIRVSSGHLKVTETSVGGQTGYGVVSGESMDEAYEKLKTTEKYESVIFSWSEGTSTSNVENFLKSVQYTTTATENQTVYVSAVTMPKDGRVTTTIDGRQFDLHYFDGHYYGYIHDTLGWPVRWTDAYKQSKTAAIDQVPGVKGYLTTLTSRAEDRFLLHSFPIDETHAQKGWLGCNRLELADSSYDDPDTKWQEPKKFSSSSCDIDFIWKWVSGPEGENDVWFGYQTAAYGDDDPNNGNDGGFFTYEDCFSNWNATSNVEPNGGAATDEAYGYYGKYEYGRWNDNENESGDGVDGYYIEFGGMTGDKEKLEEGLGQEIITAEQETPEIITDDEYQEEDQKTEISGKVVIENKDSNNKDEDGNPIREVGTRVEADITGIIPVEAQADHLTYQWFFEDIDADGNTSVKEIPGATGKQYTLDHTTFDKVLTVVVSGKDDYKGKVTSSPFDDKVRITGKVTITNETRNDNDEPVVRTGTVLKADIDEVMPDNSHSFLEYQWAIKNGNELVDIPGETGSRLTLSEELLNREIVVKVTGVNRYTGEIDSEPSDTKPTNANIDIGNDPNEDTKILVIGPTMPDMIYGIKDEEGNVITDFPAEDEDGNELKPNVEDENYNGYYEVEPGTIIKVTVPGDKNYLISEVKREPEEGKDKINTIIIGPNIPDTKWDSEYDDKETNNPADDTITITVNPADPDYRYAILVMQDGAYTGILNVRPAENGTYIADPTSETTWSAGGENPVIFTNLPADGSTYRIVSVSAKDTVEEVLKNVKPEDIIGGSRDIVIKKDGWDVPTPKPTLPPINSPAPTDTPVPTATVDPGEITPTPENTDDPAGSVAPTGSASPLPSGTPTGSAAPSQTPAATTDPNGAFTPEQNAKADEFIRMYVTGKDGVMIVEVSDLTRDIIVSGETTWNQMTDVEKQAVNSKLKASGNPYTYEQLLEMAKQYKIPGFKLRKVMKKKSKAKLKLVKCSGATIICTSTKPKVATVNKKGVIKAKKVGKTTLTFTAVKGDYTNRLVVNIVVRKKFKNAKELKSFKTNVIKTPTVLIAKKRLIKKSTKLRVYNLESDATVKYKSFNPKVLKITKKGKYTGKKLGKSLVRVTINQNNKEYLLYINLSVFKKGKKKKK